MQNMFPHQMVIWLLESVGISRVVSVGNEAVGVKIADCPWLLHDVFCVIILMHMLGLQCAWNLVLFGLWWCHHLFVQVWLWGELEFEELCSSVLFQGHFAGFYFIASLLLGLDWFRFFYYGSLVVCLEFAFLCMLLCVWLYACNSACGHCTMHGSQPVSSPG